MLSLSLSLSLCVRARARADPIILVFVPGVEYGFLCVICVYNVMWELFEGMYLMLLVLRCTYCKARCADFC